MTDTFIIFNLTHMYYLALHFVFHYFARRVLILTPSLETSMFLRFLLHLLMAIPQGKG